MKSKNWCKVSDGLPDIEKKRKWRGEEYYYDTVRVLCACKQKDGRRMVKEGYFKIWDSGMVNYKIPGDIHSVTHWRDMPELPKDYD